MSNPSFYYNQPPNAAGVAPPMMAAARGLNPAQMSMPSAHYMQQAPPFRNMGPDPTAMHRKRVHNKPARQGGVLDDQDEPSGDELDDISARDIAMARYKRNHDYLSEIFTPYSACKYQTTSITPPPLEVPQSKQDLIKQIEEETRAMEARTKGHEELLSLLEVKRSGYWRVLTKLEGAHSLEDGDNAAEEFEKLTGIKVEHVTRNVHPVQLAGLVEQQQQQQQRHRQQQRQQQQEEEEQQQHNSFTASGGENGNDQDDGTNDFFDEMVNTGQEDDDDDGSVSEFLNTADMDFEQTTATSGDDPSAKTGTTPGETHTN